MWPNMTLWLPAYLYGGRVRRLRAPIAIEPLVKIAASAHS